jgi:hypothetical protein
MTNSVAGGEKDLMHGGSWYPILATKTETSQGWGTQHYWLEKGSAPADLYKSSDIRPHSKPMAANPATT